MNADKARELADKVEVNMDSVYHNITHSATGGFRFTFETLLKQEQQSELISKGYKLSLVLHPLDRHEVYKIEW